MTRRHITRTSVFLLAVALCASNCGWIEPQGGRPDVSPEAPNVVSLNPTAWYIFDSGGMPAHPSESPEGAWSFDFPMNPGGVGYVETPFQTTETLSSVTITFRVVSSGAQYVVSDPTDIPPATFRLIIEQQGDNFANPDGRWWDDAFVYNLGAQDNQTLTVTIPINVTTWSNVNGQHDPDGFVAAMKNIGWVGVTFGGQYFAGHGAALSSGSAQFVLIDYHFN